MNKQVTEFITTTVNRDNSARDEINKSKKDFYSKYSYLKLDCEKNAIEKIVDKVEKAAEWCAKHWKLVVTAVIVIVAVVLLFTGVGTGLGAAIIAGACWGAITGAATGAFVGGIMGALTYVKSGINNSWYNDDGSMNYPPNNGAIKGTEKNITLKPGKIIGRYGNIGDKSNFVTQMGADPSRLALPPNTSPTIYQEFVVIKQIPNTIQGKIAAWGGSPGGGLQYELPLPIKQLIKEGYIIPK